MSDGHPLFAFAFRDGLWEAPSELGEADVATGNADFVWVRFSPSWRFSFFGSNSFDVRDSRLSSVSLG
jgi:hypothetical protein